MHQMEKKGKGRMKCKSLLAILLFSGLSFHRVAFIARRKIITLFAFRDFNTPAKIGKLKMHRNA